MSNLTVLLFLVTMFVVAQHGLAVRNGTTTDAIATQADGRAEIVNSSQLENIRFPRSARHAHRRHKHAKLTMYMANGVPARKGQFPYQVAVYKKFNMEFQANGAIISRRHVLTDAWYFCKSYGVRAIEPQNLVVHAGMVSLKADDLQAYDVQDTMCHELYNYPDSLMHELAVIQLTNHFVFSAVVKRIKMSGIFYDAGLPVTISGWGYTNGPTEHLQYGDFYTLSLEDCRQRTKDTYSTIGGFYTGGTGCAHSVSPKGPYAKWYDGGAPVVHRGHLVGIVVRAYKESLRLAGYVSVPHHLDWIRRQYQPQQSYILSSTTVADAPPGYSVTDNML